MYIQPTGNYCQFIHVAFCGCCCEPLEMCEEQLRLSALYDGVFSSLNGKR